LTIISAVASSHVRNLAIDIHILTLQQCIDDLTKPLIPLTEPTVMTLP
jgi:hypothetical protein